MSLGVGRPGKVRADRRRFAAGRHRARHPVAGRDPHRNHRQPVARPRPHDRPPHGQTRWRFVQPGSF